MKIINSTVFFFFNANEDKEILLKINKSFDFSFEISESEWLKPIKDLHLMEETNPCKNS